MSAFFSRPAWITGLSVRLLALTVLFVMLSEVLIFVPSIARFRRVYLEDHIAKAHLAVLALEATPDAMISEHLAQDLLFLASAHAVMLKEANRRILMLGGEMPPTVDATFDLRDTMMTEWIGDAFDTVFQKTNRVLRVIGSSPRRSAAQIEVLIDEAPLREAMLSYSQRILKLSVAISLLTAALVYLSLQWLMVRPILRLTDSMVRFRQNPEDDDAVLTPTRRGDELGTAQRELIAMQQDLRAALRQKTRLALLGAAVAKINHDLRNTLASAVLASDRLSGIDDPEVQQVTPQLYAAIDRAVAMCTQSLDFIRDDRPPIHSAWFPLPDLIHEVATANRHEDGAGVPSVRVIAADVAFEVFGDRAQLYRVFANLVLNAAQAGAKSVRIGIDAAEPGTIVVRDDGPGIPAKIRERLFRPFAGSARADGSGLGLVIAREIAEAHGGTLTLAASRPGDTVFHLTLPFQRLRAGQVQTSAAD